jgi:hypothetical protein
MMLTDTIYNIGDIIYLKTDSQQKERIVTGFMIRQNHISYNINCGTEESWHYDFEMTIEKDVLKSVTQE